MKDNFDYSDYTLISKRTNSENYLSPDGKYILKLMSERANETLDSLEQEIADSKRIAALGIPVPELVDTVRTVDGKIGYISGYIKNKVSVSRGISEHPENVENYTERYVNLAKIIHNTKCDTDKFPSIAEEIHKAVDASDFLDEEQKGYLHRVVDSVPDDNTCIHGDFQYSNVILSDSGDYAIDTGFFGYGNPIFDWGLSNMMAGGTTEAISHGMFHMDKIDSVRTMHMCMSKYLNTDDKDVITDYIYNSIPYGLAMFVMQHQTLKTEGGEDYIKAGLELIRREMGGLGR